MALIENIQREDLNPLEQAVGIQRLVAEFGATHDQAADMVGRSRSAVTNLLRLLGLAVPVRDLMQQGKLDMGHGRALLALAGMQQLEAARTVISKSLSVRETEKLVGQLSVNYCAETNAIRPRERLIGMFCASRRSWRKNLGPKSRLKRRPRGAAHCISNTPAFCS